MIRGDPVVIDSAPRDAETPVTTPTTLPTSASSKDLPSVWSDAALIEDIMAAIEDQGVPEDEQAAMCATLLRIVEQERSFGGSGRRPSKGPGHNKTVAI